MEINAQYTACPACGALGEIGTNCLFCGTQIFLKEGKECLKSRIVKHRTVTPQQYAERISIYHDVVPYGVISMVNIGHEYGYINLNGELVYPLGLDENTRVLENAIVKVGDKWVDLETLREYTLIDYIRNSIRKDLGENNSEKYQEICCRIKEYIDEIKIAPSSCHEILMITIKTHKIFLGVKKRTSHVSLWHKLHIRPSRALQYYCDIKRLYELFNLPDYHFLPKTYDIMTDGYVYNCYGWDESDICNLILRVAMFCGSSPPHDIKIEKLSEYMENRRKEAAQKKRAIQRERAAEKAAKEQAEKQAEKEFRRQYWINGLLQLLGAITIIGLVCYFIFRV